MSLMDVSFRTLLVSTGSISNQQQLHCLRNWASAAPLVTVAGVPARVCFLVASLILDVHFIIMQIMFSEVSDNTPAVSDHSTAAPEGSSVVPTYVWVIGLVLIFLVVILIFITVMVLAIKRKKKERCSWCMGSIIANTIALFMVIQDNGYSPQLLLLLFVGAYVLITITILLVLEM